MNKKPILVALLASLAISMLLWSKLQTSAPTEIKAPVVQQPTILKKSVVVSKKTVAARTRLEQAILEDSFEIREVIASAVPDMAFTDIASLTNKYTKVTFLPGDIITPMRLMEGDQIPNLARAIPPGKRAVSIAVSKITGVGGFIQQGDFVDVIATFRPRNSEPVTKIVLQDIAVLAIGSTYEFDNSIATSTPSISAAKVELVTLAVTPNELERLMYLDSGTNFRLVLKNPSDKDQKIQTRGATERNVLSDIGHPDYVAQAAAAAEASSEPVPETKTETVISVFPEPVDDGRVEIMYGATARREIYKYGGPASRKFRKLPDQNETYTPPVIESYGSPALSE